MWEIRHDFQPKPGAKKELMTALSAIYGGRQTPTNIDRDRKRWEAKADHWAFQTQPLQVTLVDYGTLTSLTVKDAAPVIGPCPDGVSCPPACPEGQECPSAPACCSFVPEAVARPPGPGKAETSPAGGIESGRPGAGPPAGAPPSGESP